MRSPLLLIVGMHRSGTSLLGSLLPACDIAMPGPLIPGDTHNPEGYFERADVTALQEQLLIDLERWWPAPRGMQPLPEGWLESPLGQTALADLIDLLLPEAEHQPGPWAIKDPRSSLLLPLWKAACQQLGIPLTLLLAVRDPAEVMVSLVRRDQAATGMDGWRAQQLWWHHNAQVLRDGGDLPLQVVSYSHWFEPRSALAQLQQLAPSISTEQRHQALQAIKPQHRRSRRQPLPARLAPPVQELYQHLERLALRPSQRTAIEQWLDRQNPLSPLAPLPKRRSQLKRSIQMRRGHAPSNQVATHPWGYLAEITCGSQGPVAEHQLAFWLEHGFRDFELSQWAALAGACPAAMPWPAQGNAVTLQVRGGDLNAWPTHAWLQHCPIQGAASIHATPLGAAEANAIALNLADLSPGPACAAELLAMAALERVWDPNPERVRLLRQFGVNASWLQPAAVGNGALRGSPADWAACSAALGLAAPDSLRRLGTTICLGSGGEACDQGLQPPLLGVPGFDGLSIAGPEQARLQALWLQGCLDGGLELVRFQPTPAEQELEGWRLLIQPQQAGRAPIVLPSDPMGANELLEELHWYRQGCPPPEPCCTPEPKHRVLLERSQGRCHTAVCISLYNYGPRIHQALESVLHQEQASGLELIVVDDASTDNGAAVVQAWMAEHHSRFARCLLLQHTANGGLASARNTAFAAAESPWCFVLDADNQLDPLAVAHCGLLAEAADPSCAVIHSLIRVQPEPGCHDPRHLVSDLPWQQEIFKRGNYIDAMALVRREAWQAVGGYTHIPGGWEDFDFWCSLIDAGCHGSLCPQVLATYTSHSSSMRNSNTNQRTYRLSRLLQARHPWLELPQARDQAVWPGRTTRPLGIDAH
ncbi:glycosyltransferase [Synechococcus sp. LA31]|uniref:glycosyltransferase n=1 Tax=Synechococcus sp. LA31 TaxID=2741953 RepID=UPI001BDCC476|nr:glycosyltransferase [Synechococcus sp. LA31]QVV67062.1 glycosyltransferase [Synechococcus sp. LA31]